MILKKNAFLAAAAFVLAAGFGGNIFAQDRPLISKTISSRPINQPPASSPAVEPQKSGPSLTSSNSLSRPVLTNKAEATSAEPPPLIKKTGSTSPIAMTAAVAAKAVYGSSVGDSM